MKAALEFERALIAYHYPCPDGIFAALAAKLRYDQSCHGRPQFIPNRVYSPCSLEALQLQGEEVLYLLDYVGPTGFAVKAARQAGRVVVLDHHKTAAESIPTGRELASNMEVTFDMRRSGATIALDYFKPQVTEMQAKLFQYIEDGDLWKWELPDSKAFHAGFGSLGLELDANKNPAIFEQLLKLDPDAVIAKGKEVQTVIDWQIAEAVRASFEINLGGSQGLESDWGCCLAIRVPEGSNLGKIRSQLGHSLAEASGQRGLRRVGLIAYREPEMEDPSLLKCSLRSTGFEDTTLISKAFGGGGHLNASSFIVPVAEFERWKR